MNREIFFRLVTLGWSGDEWSKKRNKGKYRRMSDIKEKEGEGKVNP
jgi:hypothetical protein